MNELKARLDDLVLQKSTQEGLLSYFDPMQVVQVFKQDKNIEFIALICALFSYGSAKQIVKFLHTLDFSLLDKSEAQIKKAFSKEKYRFQTSSDITNIFITLRRLKDESSIKSICESSYKKGSVLASLKALIDAIYEVNNYKSPGYEFFFNKPFLDLPKSPLKRYNMYLRWMVRRDAIDLGLFKKISKKDLIIPLDTHTHKMGLKLGLLTRKQADLKAALELTKALAKFDANDPVKYDFALYRIGQELSQNLSQEAS